LLKGAATAILVTPAAAADRVDNIILKNVAFQEWGKLLGPFPEQMPPLNPKLRKVRENEQFTRYHVRLTSEKTGNVQNDVITAWLLVPRSAVPGKTRGIVAVHPTTAGTGKDRTAGLAGYKPDEKPDPADLSRSYGLELVLRGHVVLCIDLLTDGERIETGLGPYDSRAFYQRHPRWSMVGKNTWDIQRAIDYLVNRPEVDPKRIACVGHSLGGHSSLFAAAFDPRVAVCVANGGVLGWMRQTDHWSRPGGITAPPTPGEKTEKGGVGRYTYIRNAAPYLKPSGPDFPIDFDGLMRMVSPRALWIGESDQEARDYDLSVKIAKVKAGFPQPRGNPQQFSMLDTFTYPGGHGFPDQARARAWSWLEARI